MGTLEGKTALVTGGSRGIGRAIAQRLAADGALVAVHYGSNETAVKETVESIAAVGGRAFAVRAELGVPGDADTLWSAFDGGLKELGAPAGVDIVVNNVGIGDFADIGTLTPEEFDRLFAVNVKAPFFIVQQGLPRLRDGGRIVNVSSGVTRVAYPEKIAYAMTKGAINTFGLALAKALGARGITVNSVSPGIVDTDMNADWLRNNPEARTAAAAYSAFGRVGEPEDIADVVAFAASPAGRWVTGQNLDATGGSQL